MKKILLTLTIIFSMIAFNNVIIAQTLSLEAPSESPEQINGVPDASELESDPILRNISDAAVTVKMAVAPINLKAGHLFAFCDMNTCYPPKDKYFEAPNSFSLNPDESTGTWIHIYLYPNNTVGTSTLNVRFFNTDNPDDFVSYQVEFVVEPINVNETQIVSLNLSNVAPNPVNNTAKIKLDEFYGNENIIIRNINGNLILQQNLTSDTFDFNTSSFSDGVYFYSIMRSGNTTQIGKFMVKH